jgi:acetyl esterase/lipase
MLNDAARAVRLVRQKREWKIDPHRVAIMGSSAGGHLASTLLTHFDAGKADSRIRWNGKVRARISVFFAMR